jgi:hypothetical protein
MKLVEILARELKEWPEGASHIVSASDGGIHQTRGGAPGHDQNDDVLPFTVLSGCGDEVFWNNRSVFWLSVAPDDYKTAIVTREMWQAAKDKLEGKVKAHKANKDGWIRHRGGKCPVEAGALVDVRFRSGITKTVCDSLSFRWDHTGQQGDIMAWRPHVATTEQSTEVAQTVVTEGVKAEWEAKLAANPIQWRDRIHAIDAEQKAADEAHKAATDARTAERAELVQKLAGEGLALLDKCHALMDGVEERHGAPTEDMSDWRNWNVGDMLEMINPEPWSSMTMGKLYRIEQPEYCDVFAVLDDEGMYMGFDEFDMLCSDTPATDFKWRSRPTA